MGKAFKAGDRVQLKNNHPYHLLDCSLGTIVSAYERGNMGHRGVVVVLVGDGCTLGFEEREIEHIKTTSRPNEKGKGVVDMNQTKFNIGDRVRIRQWDDMLQGHSLTEFGSISLGSQTFTVGMRPLCGQTATITGNCGNAVLLNHWSGDKDDHAWSYTVEMLEPVVVVNLATIDWEAFLNGELLVEVQEADYKPFLSGVEQFLPEIRWASGDNPTEYTPSGKLGCYLHTVGSKEAQHLVCGPCFFKGKQNVFYKNEQPAEEPATTEILAERPTEKLPLPMPPTSLSPSPARVKAYYAVKDYDDGTCIKGGTIYTEDENGLLIYRDGTKSTDPAHEYPGNKLKGCLYPLVQRHAEVGEWVLIKEGCSCSNGKGYEPGDVLQVVKPFAGHSDAYFEAAIGCFMFDREYFVLRGYKGEYHQK